MLMRPGSRSRQCLGCARLPPRALPAASAPTVEGGGARHRRSDLADGSAAACHMGGGAGRRAVTIDLDTTDVVVYASK